MKIKDYKNGKIVTLSKPFDERSKILYGFYFISFFFGGTIFLWVLLYEMMSFALTFFVIVFTAALYVAAYRFLNKCFMTEKLFLSKEKFCLIKKGLIQDDRKYFEPSAISNFRHLQKKELTNHPLAGQTFDYLGFQTEQVVINEMHGDNRLAFDYGNETIFFGQNIYHGILKNWKRYLKVQ